MYSVLSRSVHVLPVRVYFACITCKHSLTACIMSPMQPGYEVVQVDEQRIRGRTYTEAMEAITEAYNSDSPTIKLIVIHTTLTC